MNQMKKVYLMNKLYLIMFSHQLKITMIYQGFRIILQPTSARWQNVSTMILKRIVPQGFVNTMRNQYGHHVNTWFPLLTISLILVTLTRMYSLPICLTTWKKPFKRLNWNFNNSNCRNQKHHHVKVWLNFLHLMHQRKNQHQDLKDLVDSNVYSKNRTLTN